MEVNEEGDDSMQGLDVGTRETVLEDAWCLAWVSDWTLEPCIITGTEDKCPSGLGMGVELCTKSPSCLQTQTSQGISPYIQMCSLFSSRKLCPAPVSRAPSWYWLETRHRPSAFTMSWPTHLQGDGLRPPSDSILVLHSLPHRQGCSRGAPREDCRVR